MRKVRTIIGLTLAERLAVTRYAQRRGISFAAAVRELVNPYLRLETRRRRGRLR